LALILSISSKVGKLSEATKIKGGDRLECRIRAPNDLVANRRPAYTVIRALVGIRPQDLLHGRR
jgi:hypothetical protein